ncbi:NAD(+) diphosphatase [Palleronia sediminis]|uniref:NAD(+) diphosphatase n=1 Tax=Palleronia sediminis TaxID=2547833 RepID=A0A4R6A0F4_9RHOB|nr:NAD(+) diphosphatase [Palleronia sediminis]TDL76032.1 NAD(+) diphosphatase [Palleronia sediminis]
MRLAETVTFGTSDLDRAAHLRARVADLHASGAGRVLALWRGRPLVARGAGGEERLVLLARGTPALPDCAAWLFLGLDGGEPRFAADLSDWTPDALPGTLADFADPSEVRHPDLPDTARFVEMRAILTLLPRRDAELAVMARGLLEWHRTHRFCASCGRPSDPVDAGWKRLCPDCGRHHFPRTDPVVIMLVTHGNSVLLGRAPQWPEGMFSLPAGFVEPGETVEAAVRRETLEETGIHVGAVSYLSSQPWPYPASLMIGCRGAARSRELRIDPAELDDARWFSREAVMDSLAGIDSRVRPARPGAIAHFILRQWLADRLD